MYTTIIRIDARLLNVISPEKTKELIKQAIEGNRYYYEVKFKNKNITDCEKMPINEKIDLIMTQITNRTIKYTKHRHKYILGVDSTTGPDGFDIERWRQEQKVDMEIDSYESTLIIKNLSEMNMIMPNILKTIQSGPAYLECIPDFDPELPVYMQMPFVEFVITDHKYWKVAIWIMKYLHAKYSYITTTFFDSYKTNNRLRFCIARPYVYEKDGAETIIDYFDDTEFFKNIITCLYQAKKKITKNEIEICPIINDLDMTKEIYILRNKDHSTVINIFEKSNPKYYILENDKLNSNNCIQKSDSTEKDKLAPIRYDIDSSDYNNVESDNAISKDNLIPVHPDTCIPISSLNARYSKEWGNFMRPYYMEGEKEKILLEGLQQQV